MDEPRPYRQASDLERMRKLLAAGYRAHTPTYYIHPGDLTWWLHYPYAPETWSEKIYLWEDNQEVLLGWVLLDQYWRTFDVFTMPALRGCQLASEMFAWAAGRAEEAARLAGESNVRTMWISEEDNATGRLLQELGYSPTGQGFISLEHSLSEAEIPAVSLSEGYAIRPVAGTDEVRQRAAASHAAFGSSLEIEQYWPRYQSFMQSPGYPAGWDLVVVTPEGHFVAFCIGWLDCESDVGYLEPVGVHPLFQRKGFGRAVLLEMFQRMRAAGMQTVRVCAETDNIPAIELYRSVGFNPIARLVSCQKELSG